MWFLDEGPDGWANGAAAQDLAEGAQRSSFLAGIKVRSAPACNPAKTYRDGVIVKDLGEK